MSGVQVATVMVSAEHEYPVHIGYDLRETLRHDPLLVGRKVAVIHGQATESLANYIIAVLHEVTREVHTIVVPDGEPAKSAQVAAKCWDSLAAAGIGRSDLIVAVGGGTITDLAGFVAATWMRGIDVLHVPTTTAAMVDAAIGGKTGINTRWGKNLVGAFHSPVAVYCDVEFLQSLPVADHVAGLAEALKCGFIADAQLLNIFREHGGELQNPQNPILFDIVQRAVAVKADVVAQDFTESSVNVGRELLNYGHTFGHAIELLNDYQIRHGDAVAMGMVFAAELSHRLGFATQELVGEHYRLIEMLGLPARHGQVDRDAAIEAMGRDKKARGGVIRFILLRDQGDAVAVNGVSDDDLEFAMMRSLNS